ncbi:Septation initiation network scaffold protein cdc11 [Schizosaccharomyces pombe]
MEQLWLEHDLSEEWIPQPQEQGSDNSSEPPTTSNVNNTQSTGRGSSGTSTEHGTFKKGRNDAPDVPQWKQVNAKNPVARDIFARLDLENMFEKSSKQSPPSKSPTKNPSKKSSNNSSRRSSSSVGKLSNVSNMQSSPSKDPFVSQDYEKESISSSQFSKKYSEGSLKSQQSNTRSNSVHEKQNTDHASNASSSSSVVSSPSLKPNNTSPLKLFQGASDPFTREHLNQLTQDVKSNSFENGEKQFSLPEPRRPQKLMRTTERKASLNTKDLYQEVEEVMARLRGRMPNSGRESTIFLPRKLSGLREEEEQDEISVEVSQEDSSNAFPSLSDQLHLKSLQSMKRVTSIFNDNDDSFPSASSSPQRQAYMTDKMPLREIDVGSSQSSSKTARLNSSPKSTLKTSSVKTRRSHSAQSSRKVSDYPNMVVITPADLPEGIDTTQGSMEFDRIHNRWRRKGHDSDLGFDFETDEDASLSHPERTILFKAASTRHQANNDPNNLEKQQPHSFPLRKQNVAQSEFPKHSLRDNSENAPQNLSSFHDLSLQNESFDEMFNGRYENGSPIPFISSGSGLKSKADKDAEYSFSVSRQSIIQILSDVEPYEPFWKRIIQLDISRRHLDSLIGLSELCPSIEELTLEGNEIAYLTGCPVTIRDLNAVENRLSSLTSFSNLLNLQYLDISYNQLEDLTGLSSLIHLRELKVDSNHLWSLDGIQHLDGLLKLSACNNRIKELSFTNSNLHRLEELLLGNNEIEEIEEISSLQNLMVLQLDNNKLTNLKASQPMIHLRILRISNNAIHQLEVDQFPHLRTLYMDLNRFNRPPDIRRLKRLVNFSFRTQDPEASNFVIQPSLDIRNLYLSNNTFVTLDCKHMFLGVRYLELANVQLKEVPKYIATSMPNLRVLDLSHNYISDIESLKPLQMIHRLYLVGNRIKKMRNLCDILANLKQLNVLDLRMNPLNFNIYPVIDDSIYELSAASKYQQSINQKGHHRKEDPQKQWQEKELAFSSTLSEVWRTRRKMYAEAILLACPHLEWLDGSDVSQSSRAAFTKSSN